MINVLRRADVKVVVAAVSQTSPIVKCSQRTQIQVCGPLVSES